MTRKLTDPAILFDLDGTLVDTAYRHVTAWAEALRDSGILIPELEGFIARIGMSGSADSSVTDWFVTTKRPAQESTWRNSRKSTTSSSTDS